METQRLRGREMEGWKQEMQKKKITGRETKMVKRGEGERNR